MEIANCVQNALLEAPFSKALCSFFVRSASLHRGLVVAALLSGCNALTGVDDLAADPAAGDVVVVGGGGDSGGDTRAVVDAARAPYPIDDASTSDDAAVDGSDAMPPGEAGADAGLKRVFVTSTTMQANFGGLAGGDALCSQRAGAAMLGGTWRAWLSTNTTDAITRITASGPWYLTSGPLAVTRAQLTKSPITRNIDRDENGNLHSGLVWTGTNSSGEFLDDDCGDWTSNAASVHAATGDSKATSSPWTGATPGSCDEQHRLYCFEQ